MGSAVQTHRLHGNPGCLDEMALVAVFVRAHAWPWQKTLLPGAAPSGREALWKADPVAALPHKAGHTAKP